MTPAVSEEMVERALTVDTAYQGFLYGNAHVIRDLLAQPGQQEVWQLETDDYEAGHAAMIAQIARLEMRAALSAALASPSAEAAQPVARQELIERLQESATFLDQMSGVAKQQIAGYVRDAVAILSQPQVELREAARDVLAERQRQIDVEGRTPEGDDRHNTGELAYAAACYALAGTGLFMKDWLSIIIIRLWPWAEEWWKPRSKRRNLEKAGALIIAEIERLDRKEASNG